MTAKILVLIALSFVSVIVGDVIVGNDILGLAYDIHFYGTDEGVLINLPQAFKDPNTDSKCSSVNELQMSSDVKCLYKDFGTASGSSVSSSQSETDTMFSKTSVGASYNAEDVGLFQSSVNTSYQTSYYYRSDYSQVQQYGTHYYYELSLDWQKRGLTSDFENDVKNMDMCSVCQKYGYYFLVGGDFGGKYTYTQSQSYSYYNSSSESETSINNNWVLFTEGNDFGHSTSGTNTDQSSAYTFQYAGCDYQCLQNNGQNCDWVQSCRDHPAMFDFIDSSLISMVDVMGQFYGSKKADAQTCLDAYLGNMSGYVFEQIQQTTSGGVQEMHDWTTQQPCQKTADQPTATCNAALSNPNLYLTSIQFGYNIDTYNGYCNDFVSLECEYQPFSVDHPSQISTYDVTEKEVSDPDFRVSSIATLAAPTGTAFVGIGILKSTCPKNSAGENWIVGFRGYYAALQPRRAEPPYVGELNEHSYVTVYFQPGQTGQQTSLISPTNPNSVLTSFGFIQGVFCCCNREEMLLIDPTWGNKTTWTQGPHSETFTQHETSCPNCDTELTFEFNTLELVPSN